MGRGREDQKYKKKKWVGKRSKYEGNGKPPPPPPPPPPIKDIRGIKDKSTCIELVANRSLPSLHTNRIHSSESDWNRSYCIWPVPSFWSPAPIHRNLLGIMKRKGLTVVERFTGLVFSPSLEKGRSELPLSSIFKTAGARIIHLKWSRFE